MKNYYIEIVQKHSKGIVAMVVGAENKREAAKKVMARKHLTWDKCEKVIAKLVRAD